MADLFQIGEAAAGKCAVAQGSLLSRKDRTVQSAVSMWPPSGTGRITDHSQDEHTAAGVDQASGHRRRIRPALLAEAGRVKAALRMRTHVSLITIVTRTRR